MSSAALGIHPLVDALAERIRQQWSSLPELQPLAVDPQLEAISGSLDGEDLFIRNELRSSRGLRKLHLETARLGAGLQILHCVFFPDPRYDLPVFGADIVAGRGVVSAAIVDLSPVDAPCRRRSFSVWRPCRSARSARSVSCLSGGRSFLPMSALSVLRMQRKSNALSSSSVIFCGCWVRPVQRPFLSPSITQIR